jgi:hypothetical protein
MSYFSNQELFMQPEITQHNSHMVMTGVQKPRKWKRLNVDTRFCDDYNVNTDGLNPRPQPVANFNLTLPERVNEIRSMRVTHLEVPMSYYNISSNLGNNTLTLSNATTSATITVPNGQYTATTLMTALTAAIAASAFNAQISFSTVNFFCSITNTSTSPITVTFGTLPQGKSIPCSERYPMITPVQSLVPTTVALNDLTAANPNAARQNITMRPQDFYTSSQRTQRQAAAAQCLKSASAATSSTTTATNVTSSNSNLFQNIQDMDVLPFRLGWLLGFRATTLAQLSVTVAANNTTVQSPAFIDLNGPRYLYLVVDEFLNGNPHTFTTMLKTSQIRNNVLARVAVNQALTQLGGGFGSVLTANVFNGLLVSDTRTYSNKVNLQRLNVQIVNELGVPMNLNGLDFSFCLEMETE